MQWRRQRLEDAEADWYINAEDIVLGADASKEKPADQTKAARLVRRSNSRSEQHLMRAADKTGTDARTREQNK